LRTPVKRNIAHVYRESGIRLGNVLLDCIIAAMPQRDLDRAAEPGSLPIPVHRDLIMVRRWQVVRDREWANLFGALAPSVGRPELVVLILVEFGFGRQPSLKFFQSQCSHLASTTTIRKEVYSLVKIGLFSVSSEPTDLRMKIFSPTFRLIEWASKTVPKAARKMSAFFEARKGMSS
jgi:hypothetical protein